MKSQKIPRQDNEKLKSVANETDSGDREGTEGDQNPIRSNTERGDKITLRHENGKSNPISVDEKYGENNAMKDNIENNNGPLKPTTNTASTTTNSKDGIDDTMKTMVTKDKCVINLLKKMIPETGVRSEAEFNLMSLIEKKITDGTENKQDESAKESTLKESDAEDSAGNSLTYVTMRQLFEYYHNIPDDDDGGSSPTSIRSVPRSTYWDGFTQDVVLHRSDGSEKGEGECSSSMYLSIL